MKTCNTVQYRCVKYFSHRLTEHGTPRPTLVGKTKMVRSNKVKKVLKLAKEYAYRDRRQKKRNVRQLWIQQLNAGARQYDVSYSEFISGLKASNIELNRKVLADMAANEPYSFKSVVDVVKFLDNIPGKQKAMAK